MKTLYSTILHSALFLLFPFSSVTAQDRDRGPIVLELPASTRALALGDAFQLASRDADVVFYHPGRLGRAQGISASYQRFYTKGTLASFSAGTSWFGGGVAVGLQQLSYEEDYDQEGSQFSLDSTQPPYGSPYDEGLLREEGGLGVSETVLSMGYGKTIMGLEAGIVGKLVERRKGSGKAGTAAVDLGVSTDSGPFTMAFSVQNLGPAMTLGGQEIDLPTRFILGASSESAQVGPLDVALTAALNYRLDADVVPGIGLEVGYWPVNGRTFVGRVGYRYRSDEFTAIPVTFGGAFYGDDLVLEYAFQGFDEGDPSHRFSIGWR